jgi:anti-anti-sigma factor
MSDASLIQIDPAASFVVAKITCEKVGQREAQIIEAEVKNAAAPKHWRILMDVSNVTLLASMGLGMLVTLHKVSASSGGRLVIFGMREELAGLLKVTHLDKVLKIVKTREDAQKALG